MTLREFARRVAVDESAVRRAIERGRLKQSVAYDPEGRPRITDLLLAEQEWRDNRDPSKDHRKGSSLTALRKRETRARARKLEIANRVRLRELIPRREAEQMFSGMVVTARTKLLGLPSRAKQRIPHLTAADLAELERLIREVLEELSGAGE